MDNLEKVNDLLFSPLAKNHCVYFYILMIFSLVTIVINIVALLWLSSSTKSPKYLWRHAAMTLIPGLLGYYHTRLFYSMCVN